MNSIQVGASEQGGAGGIGPPHSKIWGGLSMFCPPPMKCVLINFIYIKSGILSLLIKKISKEFYQTYGGGLSIVCPPPPMKCVLIHFIYIKSSILSLLINIFSKEFYQTYGGEKSCIKTTLDLYSGLIDALK